MYSNTTPVNSPLMTFDLMLTLAQVDAASSNLNSNDAFILATPAGAFMWVGQGACDSEKQGAQQLCDLLGVSASELPEGGESGTWNTKHNQNTSSHTPQKICAHTALLLIRQHTISHFGQKRLLNTLNNLNF